MKKMNLIKLGGLWVSILAIAIAGTFQGCSDDDDDPAPSNPTKTTWELIQEDANLDSLEKYLILDSIRNGATALINLLNDTTENTIFAPDNAAFVSLLTQTPGFPPRIELINPDIITGVLAYHITPGDAPKSSLSGGDVLTSYYRAEPITVNPDGTLLTGSTNMAILIKRTKRGTNGSVNVVESVMIPPSIGASLTPILGTIAGDVLLGASFTTLAQIIAKADSDPSLGTPVSAILTVDTLTAFLPPNPVFAGAGLDSSSFTPATARATVLAHLVDDIYTVDSLTNGRVLNSRAGTTITVTNDGAGTITVAGPSAPAAPLVPGQMDVAKDNGVYHVIGGIIQ